MGIRNFIRLNCHGRLFSCSQFFLHRCRCYSLILFILHCSFNRISLVLRQLIGNIYLGIHNTAAVFQSRCCHKCPFYINRFGNCHMDISDNSAKQTVIHIASFRRNLRLFLRIHTNRQHIILPVCIYRIRNINGKAGICPIMLCKKLSVQINFRNGRYPFKLHHNISSRILLGKCKMSPIPGNKTVRVNLFLKIISLMSL